MRTPTTLASTASPSPPRTCEQRRKLPGSKVEADLHCAPEGSAARPCRRATDPASHGKDTAPSAPEWGIQYLGGRRQLIRKPGVGTPVVTFKVRRPIELASLYDDLNIAGRESHTSVLSFMLVKAFDSTATPSASPRAAASTPSNGSATRAIYRSP